MLWFAYKRRLRAMKQWIGLSVHNDTLTVFWWRRASKRTLQCSWSSQLFSVPPTSLVKQQKAEKPLQEGSWVCSRLHSQKPSTDCVWLIVDDRLVHTLKPVTFCLASFKNTPATRSSIYKTSTSRRQGEENYEMCAVQRWHAAIMNVLAEYFLLHKGLSTAPTTVLERHGNFCRKVLQWQKCQIISWLGAVTSWSCEVVKQPT